MVQEQVRQRRYEPIVRLEFGPGADSAINELMRERFELSPHDVYDMENIRVRSIVGRFLEHSRIFYFANGQESPIAGDFFIGSADWMYRNLSKRIEVVAPVFATEARVRLWEILDICLRDQRQAWILGQDGRYSQLQPDGDSESPQAMGTHQTLMDVTRSGRNA